MYLKLQSSCLLFSNESNRREESDSRAEVTVGIGMEHEAETNEDSDVDDVWNGMETVVDGRKRVKSKFIRVNL